MKKTSNKPNNMLTLSEINLIKKDLREHREIAKKRGIKIYGEPDTSSSKPNKPYKLITPQESVEMDKEMEEWKALEKSQGAKFYGEN